MEGLPGSRAPILPGAPVMQHFECQPWAASHHNANVSLRGRVFKSHSCPERGTPSTFLHFSFPEAQRWVQRMGFLCCMKDIVRCFGLIHSPCCHCKQLWMERYCIPCYFRRPLTTWMHFGHLATSPHLQLFAESCGQVTAIYDVFARYWHLLPVFGKPPIANNGFAIPTSFALQSWHYFMTILFALSSHLLNDYHKKIL